MSQIPKNYEAFPEPVMTNFDHSIKRTVEAQLRDRPVYAQYAGWNFCGYVWCDHATKIYKCEVWTYGLPIEVIEAKTLEEIMEQVSDKYGSD